MSWAGAQGLRITGEKSKRNATDLLRYRSALKRGYNRVQIGDRYRHTCVGSPETEAGILNIGDIQLEPGHRLKGTVVLPYGASVPNGMRVIISANRA